MLGLVRRFGAASRVSMPMLLGPEIAYNQHAKRLFNPHLLQTQLQAYLTSKGLKLRTEPLRAALRRQLVRAPKHLQASFRPYLLLARPRTGGD